MRKVYSPPPDRPAWLVEAGLAALFTLGVFLVLPLTQMVSSGVRSDLTLRKIDATRIEAPERDLDQPPPPVEEKAPDEPPPQLAESAPPMALNVSLDVAVGSGGALAMGSAFGGEGAAAIDTFDVSDLERRPEAVSQVAPAYPASLRKARVEGLVALVFVLNEEGRVEDARVESSSRPEFEAPALEAVRKWRFRPGMKDGKAVKTFLRLPIRFRLSNS